MSPAAHVKRRSFIAGAAAATAVATGRTAFAQAAPRAAAPDADGGAGFRQQVARTIPPPPDGAQVTCLAAGDGTLAAGQESGLALHRAGDWSAAPGIGSAVHAVCALDDDRFAALTEDALAIVSRSGRTRRLKLPARVDPDSARLIGNRDTVLLLAGRTLWRLRGETWRPERLPGAGSALAAGSQALALVVDGSTLYEKSGGSWQPVTPADDAEGWAQPAVTHVAYDTKGRLWLAGSQGVVVRDGGAWHFTDARRGLPSLGITALVPGADGDVWLSTRHAAMRCDGSAWEYREGRWLPAPSVTAAAVSATGEAHFATPKGIGVIAYETTTLAAKAELFEKATDARHRRTPYGFVVSASLSRPGDLGSAATGPSDNDGLSTGMYGAAQCFRYAVTGSADARDKARAAFRALKFLGDVTQDGSHPAPAGFVARAVTPTTDPDPNLKDSVERDKQKRAGSDSLWKVMPRRWPTSGDGAWYWKCDTSSDELDGHFFFHACYHDLVATPGAERGEVAAVVRRMADHLLDHDHNLVDYDGKPTRWGFFAPGALNEDPYHREERGLNSLSVLTYLTVADHIVGGERYARAKRTLVEEHGYELNTMHPKVTRGIGGGNSSDDNLAFLLYYHLLGYERDERLARTFAKSLSEYWIQVQYEANPRFNFTAGARLKGRKWLDAWGEQPLDLDGPWHDQALDYLRRYPLDLISWTQHNSDRLDITALPPSVTPDYDPGTVGTRRDGLLLPVDERVHHEFNTNVYRFDSGDAGTSERVPLPYLLPYWMGRHHGLVAADG